MLHADSQGAGADLQERLDCCMRLASTLYCVRPTYLFNVL